MLPRPDAACFPFSGNIGSVSDKDYDYKEGERNSQGLREREKNKKESIN